MKAMYSYGMLTKGLFSLNRTLVIHGYEKNDNNHLRANIDLWPRWSQYNRLFECRWHI